MKSWLFLAFAGTCVCLAFAPPAAAWGRTGHAIIGSAAVTGLEPGKQAIVAELLGVESQGELSSAIDKACSWPDAVRESSTWSWSAPMHFVNIPRTSMRYDRQRDCPDGLCAPEAIIKYAAELSRPMLDAERRWQAFAWLCHLVGDLHQPLHVGFLDDRGGNLVEIQYQGEPYNLHEWWDRILAAERNASLDGLAIEVEDATLSAQSSPWNPTEVTHWTEESRALVASHSYPPGRVIGEDFADASWAIIRVQWAKAAARLASVLDTVLQETADTGSD
jgi:hypothetical protein